MAKGTQESLKYKLSSPESNCVDLITSNANYPIDLSILLYSSYVYCQALITHLGLSTQNPKSNWSCCFALGVETTEKQGFRVFLAFPPFPFSFSVPAGPSLPGNAQCCLPALQESCVFPVEREGFCDAWLSLSWVMFHLRFAAFIHVDWIRESWLRCLPPSPSPL